MERFPKRTSIFSCCSLPTDISVHPLRDPGHPPPSSAIHRSSTHSSAVLRSDPIHITSLMATRASAWLPENTKTRSDSAMVLITVRMAHHSPEEFHRFKLSSYLPRILILPTLYCLRMAIFLFFVCLSLSSLLFLFLP